MQDDISNSRKSYSIARRPKSQLVRDNRHKLRGLHRLNESRNEQHDTEKRRRNSVENEQ